MSEVHVDLGLTDKVALVTGGSGSMGSAVCRCLGAEGARVAIAYHSGRKEAERLAAEVCEGPGDAVVVHHDLEDPASIEEGVRSVTDLWGGPDILVASAWRQPPWAGGPGPVDPSPPDVWEQQLRVNLEGTSHCVQAVVPAMRSRGWGRIVLVSSGAAEDGGAGMEAYAGAKAALHGFARSLSQSLGAVVLTNVVVPGFLMTERNRRNVPAPVLEHWASLTPTGRLATAEEVARVAVFLASPANGSVNGAAVRISGGR
ncbi:MAG: SDR family oxidoreductase [Candidatus Dormibacteraeota bacterium]|nr:SDR family oxidoreductase [Candidatus Dormibacteraeota bacterium]